MIRYSKTGKDGAPPSAPPRSVSGGDPKLKVALPAWSIAQPLEAKREKAAVAMAKAVNTVNKPLPVNKGSVNKRSEYMREYMRKKRDPKALPQHKGRKRSKRWDSSMGP